jgi:hypothetical protein
MVIGVFSMGLNEDLKKNYCIFKKNYFESMKNKSRGRKEENRFRNWRKQNQEKVKKVVNLVQ